jgi:ABC-2 type transport system ATP-binding protein
MNNAIHLDRVNKSLGGRQILRDISLDVERGSIFGFLGPNGAGKTTTIRIILGLFRADSGTAEVLGKPTDLDATRRHLGFVLEADGLYENISARENLAFYSRLYGLNPAEYSGRIDEALRLVGLASRADDKVAAYSKGMRQKLAIARAMAHDPELLILDEPTAGVDPTGQVEVREIVLDLAGRGKTVFLSSHNLDEVQRICDRVAFINHGEIRLQGSLDELRRNREQEELEVVVRGRVSSPDAEKALAGLLSLPFIRAARFEKDRFRLGLGGTPDIGAIVNVLSGHSIEVDEIHREKASLEEIYGRAMQEAGQ